jgi:hypothetical protein
MYDKCLSYFGGFSLGQASLSELAENPFDQAENRYEISHQALFEFHLLQIGF